MIWFISFTLIIADSIDWFCFEFWMLDQSCISGVNLTSAWFYFFYIALFNLLLYGLNFSIYVHEWNWSVNFFILFLLEFVITLDLSQKAEKWLDFVITMIPYWIIEDWSLFFQTWVNFCKISIIFP